MDIASSLQGLGSFLLYFAAAIAVVAVFILIYTWVTPHRELALIRAGNAAGAVALSGAVIGFSLPVANVIAQSVSILDMMIWSAVALVTQLALYLLASRVLRDLSRHLEEGNLAAAIMLAAASLVIGILNAACLTY